MFYQGPARGSNAKSYDARLSSTLELLQQRLETELGVSLEHTTSPMNAFALPLSAPDRHQELRSVRLSVCPVGLTENLLGQKAADDLVAGGVARQAEVAQFFLKALSKSAFKGLEISLIDQTGSSALDNPVSADSALPITSMVAGEQLSYYWPITLHYQAAQRDLVDLEALNTLNRVAPDVQCAFQLLREWDALAPLPRCRLAIAQTGAGISLGPEADDRECAEIHELQGVIRARNARWDPEGYW